VQTDREQLGRTPDALAIEHVEGIPHVDKEVVAGREPAVLVEAYTGCGYVDVRRRSSTETQAIQAVSYDRRLDTSARVG
jgi:hypothetical protein